MFSREWDQPVTLVHLSRRALTPGIKRTWSFCQASMCLRSELLRCWTWSLYVSHDASLVLASRRRHLSFKGETNRSVPGDDSLLVLKINASADENAQAYVWM